jgi:hypothetical protein
VGKLIVVDVEEGIGLTEGASHALFPKGTIKEEDWLVRQLRSRGYAMASTFLVGFRTESAQR